MSSGARVLPGEVLDGYRIERVLGEGGMGIVLAARHLELRSRAAIKLMTRASSNDHAERFLSEARAAASIQSDHVARIFAFGRTPAGDPYLVMEYLEGEDLAQHLAAAGTVPLATAAGWALEACEALAHSHALGIVHRDLKPSNLFLERRRDGSRRVKLIDFGIAKLPSQETLTSSHQLLGSPSYMSPEQIDRPREVDSRTDVWSLGVVLFQMLTGKVPFSGSTVFELARKVRDEPHPSLLALRAELPEGLAQVVDRCLAKHPEQRWRDVSALAHALGPFAPESGLALIRAIDNLSASALASATTEPGTGAPVAIARPGEARASDRNERSVRARPLGLAGAVRRHPRAALVGLLGLLGIVAALVLRRAPFAAPALDGDDTARARGAELSPTPVAVSEAPRAWADAAPGAPQPTTAVAPEALLEVPHATAHSVPVAATATPAPPPERSAARERVPPRARTTRAPASPAPSPLPSAPPSPAATASPSESATPSTPAAAAPSATPSTAAPPSASSAALPAPPPTAAALDSAPTNEAAHPAPNEAEKRPRFDPGF
jgi:hypothetical protein